MSPLGWPGSGPASSLSRIWLFDISILWPHRSQHPSIYYFSGHWDLTPNKKKINGGAVCPISWCRRMLSVMAGEAQLQEQLCPWHQPGNRDGDAHAWLLVPFYSVRDPSLSVSAAHIQGGTSLLSSASLEGARESMDISLAFLSVSCGFHSQHCVHWMM